MRPMANFGSLLHTCRVALAVRLLMLAYALMPEGLSKGDLRLKLSAYMENELYRCGVTLKALRARRQA